MDDPTPHLPWWRKKLLAVGQVFQSLPEPLATTRNRLKDEFNLCSAQGAGVLSHEQDGR